MFINVVDLPFLRIMANDVIKPLIGFYKWIQEENWDTIIETLEQRKVSKFSKHDYLQLRDRFNQFKDPVDLFILICSCTNNMMRFNKSFEFNQTHGQRMFNPSIAQKLKAYHERIHNSDRIVFASENFDYCLPLVASGDVVYIDPPYLITEAGYNAYWSETLEKSLYDFLDSLDKWGVRFLLSNVSEHKGEENPYMGRLSRYNIVNLQQSYDKVSRSGKSNAQEILVKNY